MKNNNPKGILYILLGMMVFAVQDSIMKYIYSFVNLYEVYLVRTLVSLIIILLFLKLTKRPIVFKTQYPLLTFCRVILFFFGFSSFYISLTVMPLATATALFFVTPFLITIFASIFLKEEIGLRRWSAVIIGFIGVYIILNPDFSNFDYLSLTPILCAFCYSLSMIIFSVQDAIMKYIYSFVALYEVYLIRTLVSFILILLFLILTKKPIVFKTQYPLLTFCRVILFFFGFSFFLCFPNRTTFRYSYSFILCYSFFNYNICKIFFKRKNWS